ncbi:MAG TPA: hypothetical protein VMI92_07940 [Steroidobacteraceae bacterium]|nr:hypothetical protein [Steroidobacteraceae bacterium]
MEARIDVAAQPEIEVAAPRIQPHALRIGEIQFHAAQRLQAFVEAFLGGEHQRQVRREIRARRARREQLGRREDLPAQLERQGVGHDRFDVDAKAQPFAPRGRDRPGEACAMRDRSGVAVGPGRRAAGLRSDRLLPAPARRAQCLDGAGAAAEVLILALADRLAQRVRQRDAQRAAGVGGRAVARNGIEAQQVRFDAGRQLHVSPPADAGGAQSLSDPPRVSMMNGESSSPSTGMKPT